jgi:hypothetical protein
LATVGEESSGVMNGDRVAVLSALSAVLNVVLDFDAKGGFGVCGQGGGGEEGEEGSEEGETHGDWSLGLGVGRNGVGWTMEGGLWRWSARVLRLSKCGTSDSTKK